MRVIASPVKSCLLCKEKLSVSNYPVQIVVHTLSGPKIYSKYILRCPRCRLVEKSKFNPVNENQRQEIFYHPDKYGNMKNGYMFYKQDIPYIRASNEVYLEKSLVESEMSNFMHGFMSMESAAEAYNETFRNSDEVQLIKEFLEKNPKVGKHFNTKIKQINPEEEIDVPLNEEFNEKDAETNGHRIQNGMHELHRKSVGNAFYNCWIKEELKERNINFMFGPYYKGKKNNVWSFQDSVEEFLQIIDELRIHETYKHENCAGKLFVTFI